MWTRFWISRTRLQRPPAIQIAPVQPGAPTTAKSTLVASIVLHFTRYVPTSILIHSLTHQNHHHNHHPLLPVNFQAPGHPHLTFLPQSPFPPTLFSPLTSRLLATKQPAYSRTRSRARAPTPNGTVGPAWFVARVLQVLNGSCMIDLLTPFTFSGPRKGRVAYGRV